MLSDRRRAPRRSEVERPILAANSSAGLVRCRLPSSSSPIASRDSSRRRSQTGTCTRGSTRRASARYRSGVLVGGVLASVCPTRSMCSCADGTRDLPARWPIPAVRVMVRRPYMDRQGWLSPGTRIRIARILVDAETPLPGSEIAQALGTNTSNVNRELVALEQARLVTKRSPDPADVPAAGRPSRYWALDEVQRSHGGGGPLPQSRSRGGLSDGRAVSATEVRRTALSARREVHTSARRSGGWSADESW